MKIDISVNINLAGTEKEKQEFKKWVEAQILDIRNWVQNMLEYGIELNPLLPKYDEYDEIDLPEKKSETASEIASADKENSKPIKLEDVRAKLVALSQSGKQKEVKALIEKFGAKKLTDIPQEKYPQLLKEAEAL